MSRVVADLAAALLLLAVLTQSYIDLELAADLGGWQANAPVTDLAALALVPLAAWGWLRGQRHPLPGLLGYLLLLLAGVLSLRTAPEPATAVHYLVRKPTFMYVAYGFGLAWAAQHAISRRWLWRGVVAWALSTAAVSVLTSAARIGGGEGLWFAQIAGLTPNHKTLAVSLAGGLPLLLATGRRRVAAVVGVALLLSASKTAWLMAALAAGLVWPRARPVALRWRLSLPAAALAVALAYYAPLIMNSRAMLDAARSRHSLNHRAEKMFLHEPLTGTGVGMSTAIEMATFPHYRVNGVDAHGVIQKVGGEMGLLGLAGYGGFSLAALVALRRRWRAAGATHAGEAYGALTVWAVSSAGLLLSTETFSQTWWLPAGLAWGLAHRPPPPADA